MYTKKSLSYLSCADRVQTMSLHRDQHPFYICTEDDKEEIRKQLGLKKNTIHDDVDAIMDWFKKQPHLVEAGIDRTTIERMLIISKGSMEKTKRKIDNFYKYRSMAPELIQNREKILSDPNDLWTFYMQVSIPKMYNGKRLTVLKFFDCDLSSFSTEVLFRNSFMLADIRLKYDYFLSDMWVLDMKNTSFSQILRLNPVTLQKTAQIFHEGLGIRVHSIHVVNSSPIVQHLINFMKQFFSPKIMDRILIHETFGDLHKHIPKQYLPRDYGGEQPSMTEFKDRYEKEMRNSKTKQFLIEASKMVSNENRRPGVDLNEDYLGGSFRKLDFD